MSSGKPLAQACLQRDGWSTKGGTLGPKRTSTTSWFVFRYASRRGRKIVVGERRRGGGSLRGVSSAGIDWGLEVRGGIVSKQAGKARALRLSATSSRSQRASASAALACIRASFSASILRGGRRTSVVPTHERSKTGPTREPIALAWVRGREGRQPGWVRGGVLAQPRC